MGNWSDEILKALEPCNGESIVCRETLLFWSPQCLVFGIPEFSQLFVISEEVKGKLICFIETAIDPTQFGDCSDAIAFSESVYDGSLMDDLDDMLPGENPFDRSVAEKQLSYSLDEFDDPIKFLIWFEDSFMGKYLSDHYVQENSEYWPWEDMEATVKALNCPSHADVILTEDGTFLWQEWLGSWTELCPSGKIYTPFANSNVDAIEAVFDTYWRESMESLAEQHGLFFFTEESDCWLGANVDEQCSFDENAVLDAFNETDYIELVSSEYGYEIECDDEAGDYFINAVGAPCSNRPDCSVRIKVQRNADGQYLFESSLKSALKTHTDDRIVSIFKESTYAQNVDRERGINISRENGGVFVVAIGVEDDCDDIVSYEVVEANLPEGIDFELLP